MRLIHLLEEDTMSDIIKRDCKKWLDETNGVPVFRGISNIFKHTPVHMELYKLNVRKDRNPSNSSIALHNGLDHYLEDLSGIKFRSQSIFTTRDRGMASSYGTTCRIFPIGDYDYAWSPVVKDAFVKFDPYPLQKYPDLSDEQKLEFCNKHLDFDYQGYHPGSDRCVASILMYADQNNLSDVFYDFFTISKIPFYINEKFDELNSQELMISCDTYYAVPASTLVAL